ncbi:MAG: PEP-CTERM sorting domain-containing protein [Aquabacterium sp.]|nr:PEP-CTERM sorting domain-containing protein [Aquabacterium sp.]
MQAFTSKVIQSGVIAALSLLCAVGQAQAQSSAPLRIDFALQQASGGPLSPSLGESGYLLLTFDDSTPLLTDGATTTFAPTYTAELHLDGVHPSDTDAQQIGSLYQFGGLYGLSLEWTSAWSQEGVSHTDAFTFSFEASTDAAPLLDSPSAFALFAAQQAATSGSGHVYLSKDSSSELGSTHDEYSFNAAITHVSVVPEPTSLALLLQGGLAMGGLFAARKLRQPRA